MNKCREKIKSGKKIEKIANLGAVNKSVVDYTWTVKFDHSFEIKPKPKRIPRFKQAVKVLRPGIR